ncbi:hypothetical protein SynA15127_01047 [Synechococcus sp. A15-127]|nr:hypothetical protein SynA15127_01047 [Synechococcus sp. A15-127]
MKLSYCSALQATNIPILSLRSDVKPELINMAFTRQTPQATPPSPSRLSYLAFFGLRLVT